MSRRVYMLCAAVALVLTPAAASAQGWIEPRPGPAPWGVEKVRTNVTVRVSDRIAEVEVEEWFRNNGGVLGEGDYVYPLPGEAVFTGYSLYQGEQELTGEMLDAARAREIYESIVRAKRDPALIELVGKGMVRARVFPIEPGQTRRITLRYTQVLDRAGDALQFRYAAGARHAGFAMVPVPRLTPDPMPDPIRRPMPRQVPEQESPERTIHTLREAAPLTFRMIVEDAARFRDAFSPTHDVRVERERGRMTVEPAGELDGDFAVFLPFAERAVGLTLATHRESSEDGYFMLTLSPGDVAESRVPRDVTVVVDVSGSMSGQKIEQAQRALHQLLGTLGDNDRIRLIAFSSGVREWRESWTTASRREINAARQWVDQLRANGGTNIYDALEAAFSQESPANRLPIVIFMTDGLPTNGERRPDRIAEMAESQRDRSRVFAFGVGYDVNTYLLDRLSAAARGTTQYVRPDEDVEQAVSVLAAKVRHPVLTDIALDVRGIEISDVQPHDLPDLFAGEELVLFGRYRGAGNGTVTIAGQRGGRAEQYSTRASFASRSTGNEYIARLWASRKLGDLDRRIRSAQQDGAGREQIAAMIEELRETALRYGLLSEYTSYLVQEPGMVATDVLPAAAPRMEVAGAAAVARAAEAAQYRDASSASDVVAAEKSAALRLEAGNGTAGTRRIMAGRTFLLRDSVWTDAGHGKQRVIEIAAYSDAYFALIRALPEVALVLRETDDVLIAGRAASVRIAKDGAKSLAARELTRLVADFR